MIERGDLWTNEEMRTIAIFGTAQYRLLEVIARTWITRRRGANDTDFFRCDGCYDEQDNRLHHSEPNYDSFLHQDSCRYRVIFEHLKQHRALCERIEQFAAQVTIADIATTLSPPDENEWSGLG